MYGEGRGMGGGVDRKGERSRDEKYLMKQWKKNNIWLLSYLIRKEGSFESNIKFPFLRQNRKYFGRYTAKPVPQLKTLQSSKYTNDDHPTQAKFTSKNSPNLVFMRVFYIKDDTKHKNTKKGR